MQLNNIAVSNSELLLFGLIRILLMLLWLSLMIGTGFIFNKKYPQFSFWLYLIALLTWTTGMADQYLAIPLAACAIFYQKWPAKLYFIVTTLYILRSPDNIAPNVDLGLLSNLGYWTYYHSQIWLLLLLITLYLDTIQVKITKRERLQNHE